MKVANPYDCPSCRQATFNDDANETLMFSSADENPWDGYNSALDDELALEEESRRGHVLDNSGLTRSALSH